MPGLFRRLSLLVAPALTALVVAVHPGTAHAADPMNMTRGFYVDHDSIVPPCLNGHLAGGLDPALRSAIAHVPTPRCVRQWGDTNGTENAACVGAEAAH
ncbi:hypothetical protein VM98_38290, partial [Streptomyces rubellomurinus subsp. indigoferus]